MRKKVFWLMIFILTLGTVLRYWHIDKAEGLWNDEYVSWAIASIPLGKSFIQGVIAQCHMPFYYLYLKFFMHFFGNSDFALRISSLIPGVLSILSMYFVGREFKDEKLGVLCSSITAISSFLIYFSQEVRFYGLVFLFTSLALLFTIKLTKNQNVRNLIFFLLANFLIIFTHTIGVVFVFFNFILMSIILLKNDKKYRKPIIITWSVFVFLILINLPLIERLFTAHPYSQWWGHFTLSNIGFLITDYFSPILTNIVSAPDNFFYNLSFEFIIFGLLPALIAFAGIIKALLSKDSKTLGLFLVCLAFVVVLVITAISGKLMFITKYSIEIYPILILITGFGLLEFSKGWRQVLIFSYCFLSLFYILVASNSAPKMHRSEGHKLAADLIKNAKLSKGDIILLNYHPKSRFEKYFNFNDYQVISINKWNFSEYIGPQEPRLIFASSQNEYFDKAFEEKIVNKLKPNQKIAVLILNDVAMYSPIKVKLIAKDKRKYKKTPFLFLVFSYIKNQTLQEGFKNLQPLRYEQKGSWSVITFSKKP